MSSLNAAFAAELKRILVERKISVTDAAKALQVSRQALYNYLNGVSIPRSRVMSLAVEMWGLQIKIGNSVFDRTSFKGEQKPISVAKQLTFWEKLDSIKEEDLHIGVKRVGKTLRVSVNIGIPA